MELTVCEFTSPLRKVKCNFYVMNALVFGSSQNPRQFVQYIHSIFIELQCLVIVLYSRCDFILLNQCMGKLSPPAATCTTDGFTILRFVLYFYSRGKYNGSL